MSDSKEPMARFYSVIPAGGIGSRLWPLSRASAPKFLHDLTGSGQTLLQDTWERLAPLSGADRIVVVTGVAHRNAVSEQCSELLENNLFLEPSPKRYGRERTSLTVTSDVFNDFFKDTSNSFTNDSNTDS